MCLSTLMYIGIQLKLKLKRKRKVYTTYFDTSLTLFFKNPSRKQKTKCQFRVKLQMAKGQKKSRRDFSKSKCFTFWNSCCSWACVSFWKTLTMSGVWVSDTLFCSKISLSQIPVKYLILNFLCWKLYNFPCFRWKH